MREERTPPNLECGAGGIQGGDWTAVHFQTVAGMPSACCSRPFPPTPHSHRAQVRALAAAESPELHKLQQLKDELGELSAQGGQHRA